MFSFAKLEAWMVYCYWPGMIMFDWVVVVLMLGCDRVGIMLACDNVNRLEARI